MERDQSAAPAQSDRRPLLWWPVLAPVVAWGLIGLAMLTDHAYLIDHHQLMGGHSMYMAGHYMRMGGLQLPWYGALGIFLASWQVMTVAMMLPASLPTLLLFVRADQQLSQIRARSYSFLVGYALIWTAFGVAAFLGDLLLARVSDSVPWLTDHPWVLNAAILAIAGAYELSATKDQWLKACAISIDAVGWRSRARGGPAFRCGLQHGACCVGSCWALMLSMFASDLAPLPTMVVLTVVMVAEQMRRFDRTFTRLVGVVLLLLAATVVGQFSGLSLSI